MNNANCRRLISQFLFFCFVALLSSTVPAAEPQHGFVDHVLRDESGEHKYVVFVPHSYTPDRKWPVILYLHGAGERGHDGRAHIGVGLAPLIERRQSSFPFVVVFPQCENVRSRVLQGWLAESPDAKRAIRILEKVEKDYSIDRSREILSGWSMGGYGAWSLAAATPKRWAALVPLAAGGNPEWAEKLKDIPIWMFHGGKDRAVRVQESRTMFEAIKKVGGKIRYNEFAEIDHNVWKLVFNQDELFGWVADVSSDGESDVVLKADLTQPIPAIPNSNEPFIPAVDITNAIHARLGNEVLRTLAVSLPEFVPDDALTGKIEDVEGNIVASGRSFQVSFTDISYSGELAKSKIKTDKHEQLHVQLALNEIRLRIGTTYLRGRNHSADAGPIEIVIGHREPVWLKFDVKPKIVDRKLKLTPINIEFKIPEDNWYVTYPEWVKTSGFGITKKKVRQGLTQGLYGQKALIESRIAKVIPSLMAQIEDKLSLSDQFDFVSEFWPLPVFRPRTRLWPQAVSTDENGVSLVWGITAAAAVADKAPKIPLRFVSLGASVEEIPHETGLRVALTPDILSPLSQLLIDANVGHIHVLDISEKAFAPLADRAVLARAIPDLNNVPKDTVIWSELIMAEPLTVRGESKAANSGVRQVSYSDAEGRAQQIFFHAPKLLIKLSLKSTPTSDDLTPYAEFEFQISQATQVQMQKSDSGETRLRMDWIGDAKIETKVRFAQGYKPKNNTIDAAQIQELFAQAWKAWSQNDPVANIKIPTVDFGFGKLQAVNVGWSDPHLYVKFESPGITISNKSELPLVFDIKLPDEDWSKPQTLQPGLSQDIKVSFPILYRRKTETGFEIYTLELGSHSEYRSPIKGGAPQLFQALKP